MKKIILILFLLNISNPVSADTKMKMGLEVFNNKANCGSCHILHAAGSEGNIGPNLDQLRPTIEQVIYAVKNGIGVMPPWEGILSQEEIDAVAYYVFDSTNK